MQFLKAQSAVEYVVIVGIALIILIPLWLNVNTQMGIVRTELQSTYAQQAVAKIRGAADAVYVQGQPAQFTILVNFPDNVRNVTVSGNEISMRLTTSAGDTDAVAITLGPVTGNLSTSVGTHRVLVKAQGGMVNITDAG